VPEQEILEMMAEGMSNRATAARPARGLLAM
jgi:DNA-binding NarL/FixJ family response regulator